MAQAAETTEPERMTLILRGHIRCFVGLHILCAVLLVGCTNTGITTAQNQNIQTTSQSGPENAKTLVIFGARVLVPVPFKRDKVESDFVEQNSRQFLAEFVPGGQTVYDWTEMVSVRGYDRRTFSGAAAFQVMDLISQQVNLACPESFVYEVMLGPTIGNLDTAAALMGCKSVEHSMVRGLAPGQAEIGVYAVAATSSSYIEIHYSRRTNGDISNFDEVNDPAARQAYEQILSNIRICAGAEGSGSC
jgi:hypothetical protein